LAIILHIGTPKTGTSSIQAFARRHAEALRRRGLDFPPTDLVGGPRWGTHSALAHAAAARAVPGYDAGRFIRAIRRRAERATVLLSAEALYLGRVPAGAPAVAGSGDLLRHEAFVARVRALFGDDPPEVRLVLRRRDDFATSFYQQIVQSDRYSAPFGEFLETHRSLFDYRRIVEIWAAHFPRLAVAVFEDLTAGPGLIVRFFGWLGVDVAGLEADLRNVRVPIEVTEVVRLLNGRPLSEAAVRRIRAGLLQPGWDEVLTRGPARSYFDPADIPRFLAAYAEDDREILARHHPTGRPELFPPFDPDTAPRAFEGIGLEAAGAVAARMLNDVAAAAPAAPRGFWRSLRFGRR
jgi:hypothetical protein